MEDIRQIAGEVGIERRHVESAALALNARRPSDHPWLGAPWRFRFQETVDGELPNDTVAEIIDLARRETNMQGKVSQSLDSIEWVARESLGATFIEVTRRGGRTTITVLSARTDAAASVGIAGFVGAFFGAIGVSAALAASATLAVPAAIATGVVAAGGGAWLISRSAWRRIASRYSQRAELLVRVLAEHVKPDRAP
jgi:hypothetical protein